MAGHRCSVAGGTPTRRERLRAQTLAEIREHGYAQVAGADRLPCRSTASPRRWACPDQGCTATSPPANELLITLVTESYEDLADTLIRAAEDARRRAPEGRLRAAVDAYRDWARAQPHGYRLVFGSCYGSGELDPDRIIPTAHRAMGVILAALADVSLGEGAPAVGDAARRRQLTRWGASRSDDEPLEPAVLQLALLAWTRLHGVVSLEIEGFFDQVGVDPGRLYITNPRFRPAC
jgi:hypothetical protein